MPLTPEQTLFLESWLKKGKDPVNLRKGKLPGGQKGDTRESVPLTPTQEAVPENLLTKAADLPIGEPLDRHRKSQNLKWNDDSSFEERYGDPDYYTRVRGLG